MNNDENLNESQHNIQFRLEDALQTVVTTLEAGRTSIYEIAEDCHKQVELIRSRLEEASYEAGQIITAVDELESRERLARIHLMEVSKRFNAYSEEAIKNAYSEAQKAHDELVRLRHQEAFLRKRRDELNLQLKKFESIAVRADSYIENTSLALKILEGNIDKLTDTLEEAHKKQQIGLWIVESMESERRKIARELHDGPAQTLAGMLIRMDLMEYLCHDNQEEAVKELANVHDMGRDTLNEIRRIMFDLKPSVVSESGIIATLKDYFRDYESKYNFDIEFIYFGDIPKLDLSLEVALFRMVQEAVTNARKHSGVNRAMVKLEHKNNHLSLVIKDKGRGFEEEYVRACKKDSYGIIGMKERAELLGGKMEIISSPREGTQVIIEVPTEGEENSGEG